MELGLRDRSVLVTGGTRGIGRAIALAYGREEARVSVTYVDDELAAAAVVREIEAEGGEGIAVRLDLAAPDSILSAVSDTAERFGALDVLVANAVRWPTDARAPLADGGPHAWAHAVRTNLEGTATTVHAALSYLSDSSAGRVVQIYSGVSRHGMAGATAYATAKAGLDGLIAALKWETGERDVLISIVSPGFTVTENNLARFTDEVRESVRRRTPSRRLSVPGDIAAAVLMLGSLANGNITGRVPSGRRRDRLTLPRRRVRGPVGVPRAWGSGPDARFRAGERATPSR